MHSTIVILLFAIVSTSIAVPIVPGLIGGNEDVIQAQPQINPAQLIDYFIRYLLTDGNPAQGPQINAADLVSIAGRLLGGLNEGTARGETIQDPRVINYEQQINRRNQQGSDFSRLLRIFATLLS
ncbi:unnamed protein product [Chironomus riparius]|uniref:Uncharacterized protein n=1 Tax=Chironomus riparius TaxID=315576 RepID=A0A9N9RU63_9DIPT|nr:unnamed protein product [Chironomus riparius]